jgi:ubiquinone/menaquinone biosynthesis C-methylase UbiE
MKRTTLELLVCPACRVGLELITATGEDMIEEGTLRCLKCKREYPIKEGIVHFIEPKELLGSNQKASKLYDWFSYFYRAFSAIGFLLWGGERRNRMAVLERLEIKGENVLEISIGPGSNLPFLINEFHAGEVFGLDISLGQLRRCREYCRRKGWKTDLFLASAEQLPFKAEAFEHVFHIGGFNFFNDKKAAMDEMIRVAKPGYRIVIVDELEKIVQAYKKTLPSFSKVIGDSKAITGAPVELVPASMQEIHSDLVWGKSFYCLQFRKPKKQGRSK